MKFTTTLILSLGLTLSVPLAQAITRQSKTDILVEPSSELPELAQQASQDLLLHFDGAGTPYLYLEQQQGARLVVLNVDDPAHLKVVASVATGINRPYNFVRAIDDMMEQIQFRDGSGSALLNLRAPKSPQILNVKHTFALPVRSLGDSGYLAVNTDSSPLSSNVAGRDYQVFATATASRPLYTVAGVTQIVDRPDTGTVFLLGRQGLTVIRCLSTEQQYAAEQAVLDHN